MQYETELCTVQYSRAENETQTGWRIFDSGAPMWIPPTNRFAGTLMGVCRTSVLIFLWSWRPYHMVMLLWEFCGTLWQYRVSLMLVQVPIYPRTGSQNAARHRTVSKLRTPELLLCFTEMMLTLSESLTPTSTRAMFTQMSSSWDED